MACTAAAQPVPLKMSRLELIPETRPGGTVLPSSYAAGFWEHRLEWFSIQAKHGLVGEIDYAGAGNGVIACRDGFRARALPPEDFQAL